MHKILYNNLIIKIIFSFFFAEFLGYMWHRNVNHMGLLGSNIRFTHWKHHHIDYPPGDMITNKYKNPKLFDSEMWTFGFGAIISVILFFKYIKFTKKEKIILIIFFLLIGITNSVIHDSYHVHNHHLNKYKWYRSKKNAHDIHHRLNCNYGIITYTFDRLFGTYYNCDKLPKKIVSLFPGIDEGFNKDNLKPLFYNTKHLRNKLDKYLKYKKRNEKIIKKHDEEDCNFKLNYPSFT